MCVDYLAGSDATGALGLVDVDVTQPTRALASERDVECGMVTMTAGGRGRATVVLRRPSTSPPSYDPQQLKVTTERSLWLMT